MRTCHFIAWMLPLMVLGAGCVPAGRSVDLEVWQSDLAQYVREQGAGDPAVLRNVTLADGRRGFSVIGHPLPDRSEDANGVLLGRQEIRGKAHLLYLVGMVESEEVKDIRVVAVSFEGGAAKWLPGPRNSAALRTYRNYREQLWRQRFPGRRDAPPGYTTFPGAEDSFELSGEGDATTARHVQSGATWRLFPSPGRPERITGTFDR